MTLDWHSATREHRAHLSSFSCTLPDHGYFDEDEGFVCHDYPWELEVQEFIRGMHPKVAAPDWLLVGYDDDGLAAVLAMRVSPFDRYAFIQAIGVAQRASGNGLAGEAITIAPQVMGTFYKMRSDFIVQARIDPMNFAAKSVAERAGFDHIGSDYTYETWTKRY
ncbi:MAG TPA: hypothetical protein VJR25_14160 [Microbacterium sp.]|uniref:GNAT family N-acetyltransferase n=1 Tax=Microbacterium sp. TaxID=51671 RepID=UPI002B459577|nr:hypothetical protein [Microbacterium sp.]HKT57904.1 hypothetical protein [Microbacterium sp.]